MYIKEERYMLDMIVLKSKSLRNTRGSTRATCSPLESFLRVHPLYRQRGVRSEDTISEANFSVSDSLRLANDRRGGRRRV